MTSDDKARRLNQNQPFATEDEFLGVTILDLHDDEIGDGESFSDAAIDKTIRIDANPGDGAVLVAKINDHATTGIPERFNNRLLNRAEAEEAEHLIARAFSRRMT
jgi:hypothetical protein